MINTTDEIETQKLFIEWLKSKGTYNEYASASTMVAMQSVWEKGQEELTQANTLLKECEKYIEADLCVLQDEKDIQDAQDAQELLTKLKSKGNE